MLLHMISVSHPAFHSQLAVYVWMHVCVKSVIAICCRVLNITPSWLNVRLKKKWRQFFIPFYLHSKKAEGVVMTLWWKTGEKYCFFWDTNPQGFCRETQHMLMSKYPAEQKLNEEKKLHYSAKSDKWSLSLSVQSASGGEGSGCSGVHHQVPAHQWGDVHTTRGSSRCTRHWGKSGGGGDHLSTRGSTTCMLVLPAAWLKNCQYDEQYYSFEVRWSKYSMLSFSSLYTSKSWKCINVHYWLFYMVRWVI